MKDRLAFDVSRYQYQGLGGLVEDLAGWTLEAGEGPLEERVNAFKLEETLDGLVVNRALGDKDVAEGYANESVLESKETKAGLGIRECLLNQPLGTISVWISPPGGLSEYDEGRMVVGVNKEEEKLRLIESYGISNNFSAEDCLLISLELNQIAKKSYDLKEPEDIRDKVFLIDEYKGSPWEFLSRIIPLKKVWESIGSGEAKKAKEEALRDAWEVAGRIESRLDQAVTRLDYLYVGALGEKMMAEKGRRVASGPCGMTNSEVIDFLDTGLLTHVEMDADGVVSSRSGKAEKFVKSCPKCNRVINRVIKAGYRCACGGVYEGC